MGLGLLEVASPGNPTSIPSQSMWVFRQTKWHCDRFLPAYLCLHLSVSFHRRPILIFTYRKLAILSVITCRYER